MKDSQFFNKKVLLNILSSRELNSRQDALRFAFLNSEKGDENFSIIVEIKKNKFCKSSFLSF